MDIYIYIYLNSVLGLEPNVQSPLLHGGYSLRKRVWDGIRLLLLSLSSHHCLPDAVLACLNAQK